MEHYTQHKCSNSFSKGFSHQLWINFGSPPNAWKPGGCASLTDDVPWLFSFTGPYFWLFSKSFVGFFSPLLYMLPQRWHQCHWWAWPWSWSQLRLALLDTGEGDSGSFSQKPPLQPHHHQNLASATQCSQNNDKCRRKEKLLRICGYYLHQKFIYKWIAQIVSLLIGVSGETWLLPCYAFCVLFRSCSSFTFIFEDSLWTFVSS